MARFPPRPRYILDIMLHLVRPSRLIEPCLPSPADQPPTGAGWVHQIKHDGYRLMARRDPIGIRLLTRNGHDWSPRYPAIVQAVDALRVRSCLISSYTPSICWSSTARTYGASRSRRARRRLPACCVGVGQGCG
jgi:ATP-dependent DNA ligase